MRLDPVLAVAILAAVLPRTIALSRCLHGLLNLRRSSQDLQLDFRSAAGVATPASMEPLELKLEVVVVIHQDACLLDVIAPLVPQVRVLRRDLDDPRELGLEARDWLINHPSPADLNLYLEDDLVIHDSLFADKILWMAQQSNHQCVLLPHRYELTRRLDLPPRLLIDGEIDQVSIEAWHRPSTAVATGEFRGVQGSGLIAQAILILVFWYITVTAFAFARIRVTARRVCRSIRDSRDLYHWGCVPFAQTSLSEPSVFDDRARSSVLSWLLES